MKNSGVDGKIFDMGKDTYGNDIYALSIYGERGMPYRLIESFLRIYSIPPGNLLVVNSKVGDNWFLLAGRLLEKIGLLASLGCFFTCTGIKKMYGELRRLSSGVRDGLVKSLD